MALSSDPSPTAVPRPRAACALRTFDSVIVGGVVSRTVTVNEALAWLPAASFAVQLTCVVPRPKPVPDAGLQLAWTVPDTASAAVTVAYVTVAPVGPVASSAIGGSGGNTGGCVSAAGGGG